MGEVEHFDAVIIGSGFGGSVMAYRLAEAGKRVCVLERGKRYPPGSFARSPKEMSNNFWDPSEGRQGLFQVWRFGGIDGLVSSGLGGGSLIYANVLIRKDERWFVRPRPDGGYDDWPITRADLDPHYDRVEAMLKPQRFPFAQVPYSTTPKTLAFREAATAAGLDWSLPDLAVTFGDPVERPVPGEPIRDPDGGTTANLHHRTRYTCRLCGECDIGCNYGSKNTLDYNYLTAADRLGAALRDHCEVRSMAPLERGGYAVSYVVHRPEAEGHPTDTAALPIVEVTADQLILSAGTFGSAFLLLKNRDRFPGLSPRLGQWFSGNGDFLGLLHDAHETVGSQRRIRTLAGSHGSVITSTVRLPDRRDGGSGPGLYLQDGGYPGFLDWLIEATNLGGEIHRALRFVDELVERGRTDLDADVEQLIGDAHRSASFLPLLAMGMDTPGGVLSLDHHGSLALDWTTKDSKDYFDRALDVMGQVADRLDAKLQVDPIWHLHRKVVTVHAVGGCSMGRGPENGVIDNRGQVFGYPGFTIADGSVMPGPVGPNPSFTIAALSDRFADRVLDSFT